MAIVPDAVFTAYLQNETGITDAAVLSAAKAAAEGQVRQWCQRSFELTNTVATARVYGPLQLRYDGTTVRVGDFTDTASLIVSNYGTTVASTSYQLEPLNGINLAGDIVPFEQIRLISSVWTTTSLNQATITITAKWGWTVVPDPVIEAVKMLGKDYITARGSKFGFVETVVGPLAGGRNWMVINALGPYRRSEAFGLA